jgi:hypothetical protein
MQESAMKHTEKANKLKATLLQKKMLMGNADSNLGVVLILATLLQIVSSLNNTNYHTYLICKLQLNTFTVGQQRLMLGVYGSSCPRWGETRLYNFCKLFVIYY